MIDVVNKVVLRINIRIARREQKSRTVLIPEVFAHVPKCRGDSRHGNKSQ